MNNKQVSIVKELIAFLACEIQGEYYISEKQLKLDVMYNTQKFDSAINVYCFSRLTDMLALIPNSLLRRNFLRNCALASSNLGIVSTEEDEVVISIMVRSNIDSIKYQICDQMTILCNLFGTGISFQNDYPAWEYKNHSKIKKIIFEEYRKEFNSEPVEQSIHGGLECAYFAQKIPELDIVSISSNIYDVHSVKERMSISSAYTLTGY